MRPRAFKACSRSAGESSFELIAMVRRRTPSSKWPRCAASRPDCRSIAASAAQAGPAAAIITVAAVASTVIMAAAGPAWAAEAAIDLQSGLEAAQRGHFDDGVRLLT